LIAGKTGLHRRVRLFHIFHGAETVFHGEEMIWIKRGTLTASSSILSSMDRMIRHGVSCLCLEAAPGAGPLSSETRRLADDRQVPLILIPESIDYAEITQSLHALIMTRQYAMLDKLDHITKKLQRLALTSPSTHNILKFIHQNTGAEAVLIPAAGKPQCVPGIPDPSRYTELKLQTNDTHGQVR